MRIVPAMPPRVDLYSDTQTRPTRAMRQAIAEAVVGDEQRGEDPTTTALEARVAELLGKEAAVFLPSGTMCNEIAIALHVGRGEEVLLGDHAHPLYAEGGGPAAWSGAVMTVVPGDRGVFTGDALAAAIVTDNRYRARSRLVSVEQPTNIAGGRIWPLQTVREVIGVAREHGLSTHLDGARLPNAVVASGIAPADWAEGFDTAWIDFSKGLGAPVGACLAASRALIDEAWRYKQMMGGALRQSGIVAAAALHALDHHWDRLADDHLNARRLAEGLAELPGVEIDPAAIETNIVVWSVPDAPAFTAAMEGEGVRVSALDATRIRAVTHLDVDADGIEIALVAAARVLA
jgi:threonine aldolase